MGPGYVADQGSVLFLEERRLYVLVSQSPNVEKMQLETFRKDVKL